MKIYSEHSRYGLNPAARQKEQINKYDTCREAVRRGVCWSGRKARHEAYAGLRNVHVSPRE
jgi:hypothetical protein